MILTTGAARFLGGPGSRTAKEGAGARKQAKAARERPYLVFMFPSPLIDMGFQSL